MGFLNTGSLLILTIIMLILFGGIINQIGRVFSAYVAGQLKDNITRELEKYEINNIIDFSINEGKELLPIFRKVGKIHEDYFFKDKDEEGMRSDLLESESYEFPLNVHGEDIVLLDIPIIEYRIWGNGELMFSSADEGNGSYLVRNFNLRGWLLSILDTEVITDIVNSEGNRIGELGVRLNPDIIFIGYGALIISFVIVLLIAMIITKIITWMLSNILIHPLSDLQMKMDQLADGDMEAALKTEIVLKKPMREVEGLVNTTNKIMGRMNEYVKKFEFHQEELEAQNDTLEENSNILRNMNLELADKNLKLENILNNVEQGFFTFKADLLIDKEYSLECEKIFNRSIHNCKLSLLLYPEDKNQQTFIDELLIKILSSNHNKRSLYIPLLPNEIEHQGRALNIAYNIVKDEHNDGKIMVVLTDITEKRELERKMNQERNTLKMVVKAIVNRGEFIDLVKEFKLFTNKSFKKIDPEEYPNIIREIHTFKGNFSQFDMVNLVPKLNDLEDKLYIENCPFRIEDISQEELLSWLQEDIDIIESYVGENFTLGDELFFIEKNKIIEIEEKIQQILPGQESKWVIPLVTNLRRKSMKELLKTYPDYVVKLSERLEKSIRPFEIKGDDVFVDTSIYYNLSKSLVHIFRNCVDHGIETEDERVEKGKEETGSIECEINDNKDYFEIRISDDGKGIDLNALKGKALKKGVYTSEQLDKMSQEELEQLIFNDGISTKEKASLISGRGVGLASVKECVKELKGSIHIESHMNKGTTFIIQLPKKCTVEKCEAITPTRVMEAIVETSKNYLSNQDNLKVSNSSVNKKNVISLGRITSLVSLKGSINAIVMISVNEDLGAKLVRDYLIDPIQENQMLEYIEEVLGEVTNTIIGNAFGMLQKYEGFLHLGIPAMISNKDAYVKYSHSEILTCSFTIDNYNFDIHMLSLDEEFNELYEEE